MHSCFFFLQIFYGRSMYSPTRKKAFYSCYFPDYQFTFIVVCKCRQVYMLIVQPRFPFGLAYGGPLLELFAD